MDVKTLSAMLGHVSAATTLDIYTHITDDMRLTAAANIDRGIGKAAPQEDASEPGWKTCPGPGGKAEKDRLQALRGPQAQIRHRLHQRDQRPPL